MSTINKVFATFAGLLAVFLLINFLWVSTSSYLTIAKWAPDVSRITLVPNDTVKVTPSSFVQFQQVIKHLF